MTNPNQTFDPGLAMETAKYACILSTACFINKTAELAGETPLSEEQLVEVSLRAGDELPDSIATTMDNPAVVAGIVQKLTDAAMELANAEPKTPSVTPEDVQLVNIGQGQILQQVAGNPHANTGGIELHPEVKIIESQLMTGKKADMNPNTIIKGDDAMTINEKEFRDMQTKVAALTEGFKALTSVLTKIAEAEIPAVTATDQGNNPTTKPTEQGTVTPAKVDDKTKDNTVVTQPEAGAVVQDFAGRGAPAANPNPEAGKIARSEQLRGIIKKYVPATAAAK